jgi:hypothetical protein
MTTNATEYFEKALKFVQGKGYDNIKSSHDDYSNPTSFSSEGDKSLTPDITATKGNSKSYFQISLKNEDETATVSKWKLFATLAEMKNGKLYLLAPRGHKSFTDKLVATYGLNATVVSI